MIQIGPWLGQNLAHQIIIMANIIAEMKMLCHEHCFAMNIAMPKPEHWNRNLKVINTKAVRWTGEHKIYTYNSYIIHGIE